MNTMIYYYGLATPPDVWTFILIAIMLGLVIGIILGHVVPELWYRFIDWYDVRRYDGWRHDKHL